MKKVIITGGNGSIAQAIRIRLENEGFRVYAPSRYSLDVTNAESIKHYMEEKGLDILINCAGYIKPERLYEISESELRKHVDVNLIGSILCSQYAIQNGATYIINIGSSAGVNPKAGWLSYCVTKSALTMLGKCMTAEGIRNLTLHIGRTDTTMRSKLFPNEGKELLMTPNDVADAIYYAISTGLEGTHQIKKATKNWEFIE